MGRKFLVATAGLGLALALHSAASAAIVNQFASSVIGFSSEFSSTNWSAAQALGAPNTFAYGDLVTAWAPLPQNGTLEFITVGFTLPVFADGFVIRETYGNGFVYQVDVLDTANVLHTVWTGADPSPPGSPVDFTQAFTRTSFLVKGLKVYSDTNHNLGAWEEIDSIQLLGNTDPLVAAVPEPATASILGLGMLAFGLLRLRRRAVFPD